MGNLSLLKECVELLLETGPAGAQAPFVIQGPVHKARSGGHHGSYAIYREFPVVMPPGMMDAMRVTPDDLEDGAVTGEHEIILDIDVHFQKSRFRGSHLEPPDPDEWEAQNWEIENFDGFELSKEDAAALKAYMGELTDDELEAIQQAWFDRGNDEPDYPEPDDFDDDRY